MFTKIIQNSSNSNILKHFELEFTILVQNASLQRAKEKDFWKQVQILRVRYSKRRFVELNILEK